MVKIVPLRQAHIFDLAQTTSPWPFVGLAGVDGAGRVVGVGALVHQGGRWIATLQVREGEAAPNKVALVKAARTLLGSGRAMGLRIVAYCDGEVKGSRAFMERLGFRLTGGKLGDEPEWVLE